MATITNDPITYAPSIRAYMRTHGLKRGDDLDVSDFYKWNATMANRFHKETGEIELGGAAWIRWLDQLEVADGAAN